MNTYIDTQKELLKKYFINLGKYSNICPCKKKRIKNYDSIITERWLDCWQTIHKYPLYLPQELNLNDENQLKQVYSFFVFCLKNFHCHP